MPVYLLGQEETPAMSRTKKTEETPAEETPKESTAAAAAAATDTADEVNTVGWLARRRDAERMAFRDFAQVFSHADGVPTKHATYVGDVAAHELTQVHAIVARMAWGGPGKYVVWLLDRNTGQKVKGMFASFAVAADLRSEAPGGGAGPRVQGETASLIVALSAALKPTQDPMAASLIQRALDDGADIRVRMGKAYDDGFSAGYARGKIDGSGAWKPADVVDLVKEVRGIILPGMAAAASSGGGGRDPSLLDSFRLAVDEGIPPRTMVKILQTYIGPRIVETIKTNLPAILEQGKKDPEMSKLLEVEKNQQWLLSFATEIQGM